VTLSVRGPFAGPSDRNLVATLKQRGPLLRRSIPIDVTVVTGTRLTPDLGCPIGVGLRLGVAILIDVLISAWSSHPRWGHCSATAPGGCPRGWIARLRTSRWKGRGRPAGGEAERDRVTGREKIPVEA
jgi:hypothetical protein